MQDARNVAPTPGLDVDPPSSAWRWRAPWVVAAMSVLVALVYTVVTPPGQPYDEPAHWTNVQFYGHEHRMPELGKPHTSYEAQMGPVYYTAAALIARPTEALFGEEAALYAVRVVGALLVGVAVMLTVALGLALFPRRRGAVLAAGAVVGFNPNLLAVGASVQNDYLTMVLALIASILVVEALQGGDLRRRRWFVIGAVVGLATLAKVFAVALLGGIGVALLLSGWRDRRRRVDDALLTLAGFAVVSGWWFVRNVILYGDVSGRTGANSASLAFPAAYHDLGQIGSWLRSLLSYFWVPTEYYRNAFTAPVALRGATIVATIGIVILAIVGLRHVIATHRGRPLSPRLIGALFLASWFTLTFAGYTVIAWNWTNLAPRIVFIALPAGVLLVSVLVDIAVRSPRIARALAVAVVGLLLLASVVVLVDVARIRSMPFWIDFT